MNVCGDFLTTYAGRFSIFVDLLTHSFAYTYGQIPTLRTKYPLFNFSGSSGVVASSVFRLSVLCQRCKTSDWSFANRHGTNSVRFLISSIVWCRVIYRSTSNENGAKCKIFAEGKKLRDLQINSNWMWLLAELSAITVKKDILFIKRKNRSKIWQNHYTQYLFIIIVFFFLVSLFVRLAQFYYDVCDENVNARIRLYPCTIFIFIFVINEY